MRISRWYALMAVALVASLVLVPTVAFAAGLLTNEWGQSFLGSGATTAADDGCMKCHTAPYYNQTTHGQFAKVGTVEPGTAMYPAGVAGKGATVTGVDFVLGGGTGLREYLVADFNGALRDGLPVGKPPVSMPASYWAAEGKFAVPALEWDPSEPSLWEIDGTTGIEWEDYACNQCHMLGATKFNVKPPISGASTGTVNSWATEAGADLNAVASYVPGLGIQCERCHGTGVAASGAEGAHWGTGVKVVGYNNIANVGSDPAAVANVASGNVLKSEVCGQCHGSFKTGGNIAGYTPDRNINAFVKNPFTLADIPTVASFTANPGAYKFYPSGQNKGNKHVYYTEWALSAHSVRTFFSKDATDSDGLALTTPYQQSGASHFSNASPTGCKRCHTGEGYLKRKGAKIMNGWTEGVDAAGKIGQECVVCHISHGNVGASDTASAVESNEAVGMAVRSPEKAGGAYSTKGLGVDNKSICEDCHNWQFEVLGTNPVPVTTGRFTSHPQREVYHGRAFFEVAQGTDFMPGAKCEQCHMPATRSDFPDKTELPRYADRSWKRYSHRMFIMMPGDAEAWGLAPWGDSCSPCHAGESQTQLQDNIDSWQSAATALDQTLVSAITAAKARTEASGNGAYLVAVAYSNEYMFAQDSSNGAHNPPYIQAALKKSIEIAKSVGGSITVSAPAKAAEGALIGVQGMVMNGDGSHAAGVEVKLYKGTTLLGTALTDDNGNYGFAAAGAGAYSVKWARSSKAETVLSASANVALDVPKVATDLDLFSSKSSVTRGGSYTLSGNIDPAFSGASISLYYKKPGSSSYVKFATLTTGSTGKFSKTIRTGSTTVRGTWTWRVKFAGDASHFGSSATTKVIVR